MNETITIQVLDQSSLNWLRQEAQRQGLSVESIVLNLIRREFSASQFSIQLPTYDDLDDLAGTWSEEEALEFLSVVEDFNRVDKQLWR